MDDTNDDISPELLDAYRAILKKKADREAKMETYSYDGVRGLPPEWVGDPIVTRFRATRNRVLHDWKYSPDQAVEWLDRFCRIGEEGNDWFYPAIYPCGRPLDSDHFRETIGTLANLRWIVSLGPEKGLEELLGPDALLGFKRRSQLRIFGHTRGTDIHDEREKEWSRWNEEGARLKKINPHLAHNKSELAFKIKKNLDLEESVRTIRNRL